jgi:hypothetical protein
VAYYIGTSKQVPQTHKAHLQLKKHNYFNFAESKREAEESVVPAAVVRSLQRFRTAQGGITRDINRNKPKAYHMHDARQRASEHPGCKAWELAHASEHTHIPTNQPTN